ncbi:MAG: DNA repair protein RecN [Eubacteriales bacterium]|nr:DNA repair protein RecN [Eubacteriales bacterium]
MLNTLRIQNMALIPAVEINFGANFNVLTGETGAGKSIIIGSLNFIFGDKLSVNAIRHGADFARVTAVFDDTIIVRTLHANGKSEIRVNDEPMTIKGLREVAGNLIDIHGQHDTEKLLDAKNHLSILDAFAKTDLTAYQNAYNALQNLKNELSTYGDNPEERARLLDLYRYQINEIERAHLSTDEEETLEQRALVLRNTEKLAEGLQAVVDNLNEADGALGGAEKRLLGVQQYDTKLQVWAERLSAANGEVTDILLDLRDYLDSTDFSADALESVYDRLDEIKNLKRKYGATVADVLAFCEKTKAEQERLLSAGDTIQKLQTQITAQTAVVTELAAGLTKQRQAAATQLAEQLINQLKDLGMEQTRFEVQFTPATLKNNGADSVGFLFSANPGEPVRPLAQIISGGEMSRLMLALKTVANPEPDKTLVFDEIDTGISGKMGVALAAKLAALSRKSQIIVVTHLASVAAAGDTHFLIQKNVSDNQTVTNVYPLDAASREQEIARIIGGGDTALAHARALLSK